ncbi:MAG TPA: hypothetical protein VGZ27_08555 [Vicinamibacterales bacterium]|nr:hypothetical protein [Vicinamibacterales bacterium]
MSKPTGREGQTDIAVRPSAIGVGYELVWSAGDGRTYVEHSSDPEELLRRRRALENWLKLDGWVRDGRVTPAGAFKSRSPWIPVSAPLYPAVFFRALKYST